MASRTRFGVAGVLVGCLLAAVPTTTIASRSERRVLAEVNDYRVAHGVPELRRSRSLARSAGRYALHLLRTDEMHHHDRVWASSRFALAGENLAWQPGRRARASTVVRRWADSPPHREVLLHPRLRYGGVGREYGMLGSRRATVWVLHVGAR